MRFSCVGVGKPLSLVCACSPPAQAADGMVDIPTPGKPIIRKREKPGDDKSLPVEPVKEDVKGGGSASPLKRRRGGTGRVIWDSEDEVVVAVRKVTLSCCPCVQYSRA